MKQKTIYIIGGVILALLVIIGWLVGYYNSFVTDNKAIDAQWQQIEVQYQRRFDLIPNLVEAAKGIMQQEQAVFGQIAEARTRYSGAKSVDEKVAASDELDSALSRLLVIVENYPQLKSDQAVIRLQDELAGTENRVAVERRKYNELVQTYNTKVSALPGKFLATIMGFHERAWFESTEGAEKAPQVKF